MSERVRAAAASCAAARLAAEVAWRQSQALLRYWATEKMSGSKEDEARALSAYLEARTASESANERFVDAKNELSAARAEFVQSQLGREGGWP
jgi:hypothetical protein